MKLLMSTKHAPWLGLLCALALSFLGFAQPERTFRIGVLETTSASANRANLDALLRGLSERGYIEGKNVVIDYRSADGRSERFADLAAELIRARPDIIVTRGTAAALAAKRAGTIPVVMAAAADPVGSGIVTTLARPGGNVTGLTAIVSDVSAKRVEILKELIPDLVKVGAPLNMSSPPAARQWKEIEHAARSLGLQAVLFDVRDEHGLNRAFAQASQQGVGAFIATGEAVIAAMQRRVAIRLAEQHRLAVIYTTREAVETGGLVSYGVHYPDLYYRAASYVDRILKGAKPGELPVEQPTKLELVINVKTARALGIAVPRELLLRADAVIP